MLEKPKSNRSNNLIYFVFPFSFQNLTQNLYSLKKHGIFTQKCVLTTLLPTREFLPRMNQTDFPDGSKQNISNI